MSGDHNMNQHASINKHLQKPWQGLTSEDYDSMRPRVPYTVNDFALADVAAIVEAKLKEKNYERRTF